MVNAVALFERDLAGTIFNSIKSTTTCAGCEVCQPILES
jgi:hypothetical protein